MEKVTAFILAGGKSRRRGMDKGFCQLNDQAFIPLISKCLLPVAKEVIIVSNIRDYDVFGLRRIEDIYPGKGPIAGIHAALEFSATEKNIIVSCDIPFISTDLIQKLLLEDEGQEVVYLATEKENMPLIALYKKHTVSHFTRKLETNALKLKDALSNLNVKRIQVTKDQEKLVSNINTAAQLNEINHGS